MGDLVIDDGGQGADAEGGSHGPERIAGSILVKFRYVLLVLKDTKFQQKFKRKRPKNLGNLSVNFQIK